MSRWSSSSEKDRSPLRRLPAPIALGVVLALPGCVMEKEVAIGETIEMGPWKFHVERALDTIETNASRDQFKVVIVEVKLHNYTERHEKTFDDFLNGNQPRAIIAFPKIELQDEDGTTFDGWATPDSGGSLRSEGWTMKFHLIRDSLMESSADLARPYLDTELSSLRLVITNPDRLSGQPGSVSIRLG